MAKNCITCGKSIGLLTVRIPLLDNENIVICMDCFEKMPAALLDLYHKRILPNRSDLINIKDAVLNEMTLNGYNNDTKNVISCYFDNKISKAKDEDNDNDNSLIQKTCPICQRKVAYEQNNCMTCGYIFKDNNDLKLSEKEIAEIYNERHIQYKNNPFYEYDLIVIPNNKDGSTDTNQVVQSIRDHAHQGWRLITMFSNEIGKNALAIGGIGTNTTMCEDVLLFERCIKPEKK